ncbi:MAG TPA: leucine-rich repeat domain-containing protein, partial [Candidatus Paceibacterota bacterium]|nr:leucine-rich repeat domain-containing protein [Candidatus Paceibacterota bacterium]
DDAFEYCTGLTNVIIADGVLDIGDGAFSFCTNLTSVSIGGSVTNLGVDVFKFCAGLRDIAVPDGVIHIGDDAFSFCTGLNRLAMSGHLASLGGFVFAHCTNLSGVYFPGDAPTVGWSPFSDAGMTTVYYLPSSAGWEATYGGRPTTLWRPQMLVDDSDFGVRTNQFGFNIGWANGMTVVVEACTNLAFPVWSAISTNIVVGGLSHFSDPEWTKHPNCFYRLRRL